MTVEGYYYQVSDCVAEGTVCAFRVARTPSLKRKGLIRVEAHDWDVAERDKFPKAKVFGYMDRYYALNFAAAILHSLEENNLAGIVDTLRGNVPHSAQNDGVTEPTDTREGRGTPTQGILPGCG